MNANQYLASARESLLGMRELSQAWQDANAAYFLALETHDEAAHFSALVAKAEILWVGAITKDNQIFAGSDIEWLLENVFARARQCTHAGIIVDLVTACRGALLHAVNVMAIDLPAELSLMVEQLKTECEATPHFALLQSYTVLAEMMFQEGSTGLQEHAMDIYVTTSPWLVTDPVGNLRIRWEAYCIQAFARHLLGDKARVVAMLMLAYEAASEFPPREREFYQSHTAYYMGCIQGVSP